MSQQSHYEKLGVKETASFDEIQEARNRLLEHYSSDRQNAQMVEEAYDAILMDRLRMRQEGKIKVPDGVRFAEKVSPPPAASAPIPAQMPNWFQSLIDRPDRSEFLSITGVFGVLVGLTALPQSGSLMLQLLLGVGLLASVYFLTRKENRFGRALLLTLSGLICGLIVGYLLSPILPAVNPEIFLSIVAFVFLWFVSCFLR